MATHISARIFFKNANYSSRYKSKRYKVVLKGAGYSKLRQLYIKLGVAPYTRFCEHIGMILPSMLITTERVVYCMKVHFSTQFDLETMTFTFTGESITHIYEDYKLRKLDQSIRYSDVD